MLRHLNLAILALIVAVIAEPASAQFRDWDRGRDREVERVRPGGERFGQYDVLDTQQVDPRESSITFRLSRRDGRLGEIRLRPLDRGIAVRGVEIVFGNGERQAVNLFDRIEPGDLSRPIDLAGERRFIREVTVFTRPRFGGRPSALQLLGGRVPDIATDTDIPRNWVLLGSHSVDYGLDRDVIRVDPEVGRFDRIALRVRRNDIVLREVTIVFGNGQTERQEMFLRIPPDARTRAIEIPDGKSRFIREIQLVYQSRPDFRGERAVVEVYGEYNREWLSYRDRDRDRGRGEWVLLGRQKVKRFGTEVDSFAVGREAGRMRAIKVIVRKHDVRFYGLRITYGNGSTEDIALFGEIDDGRESAPIDLKGRDRVIDRVEMKYRTSFNLKGDGVVEVWGLR